MMHKTSRDMTLHMRTNDRQANNGIKYIMMDWEVHRYKGSTIHYFVYVPLPLFMSYELKALQVTLKLVIHLFCIFLFELFGI
jgi:hypothetical protein